MRAELSEFLAGREEWPSWRDFVRAGRSRLREMVHRSGGAERWAEELGVRFVRRKPGYAPRWTESRVREELREFLRGRSEWPERREFEAAGRKLLRDAVNRLGGVDRWAAEFGLRRPHLKSGSHRVYDEMGIESELRGLLGDRRVWPSVREFQAAGRTGLLSAVYRHGGPALWADRLGVNRAGGDRSRRQRHSRGRSWTDERIRAELGPVCDAHGGWPGEADFAQAGRLAAYKAASRYGGIARWRRELGVADVELPE